MKYVLTYLLSILFAAVALAQSQNSSLTDFYSAELRSLNDNPFQHKALWPKYFSADRQQQSQLSPIYALLNNNYTTRGGSYWMGSMTTQSYNKGKFGTYYLWDMQGNLRESRTFLDIAGKNKRGLKLVFRRR